VWNAREVLGRMYSAEVLKNPTPDNLKANGFSRMYADIYHGPKFGAGVNKQVNNKTGAEIVFDAKGKLETRTNYKGTFNYGTKMPGSEGNGYDHKALDMAPYAQWGSGFNDTTPELDKTFGAGATDLLQSLAQPQQNVPYNPYGF
jgi:hypothetical protein